MRLTFIILICCYMFSSASAQLNNIIFKFNNDSDSINLKKTFIIVCNNADKSNISFTIGIEYYDTTYNKWKELVENIFCKKNCMNRIYFKTIKHSSTLKIKYNISEYIHLRKRFMQCISDGNLYNGVSIRFFIRKNPTIPIKLREKGFIEKSFSKIAILKLVQ